jgi:hypothetical protein
VPVNENTNLWRIFAILRGKKMVTTIKQQSQMKFFGKFLKESSHFKEEKYELAKTFEGFGQISNFLLF